MHNACTDAEEEEELVRISLGPNETKDVAQVSGLEEDQNHADQHLLQNRVSHDPLTVID